MLIKIKLVKTVLKSMLKKRNLLKNLFIILGTDHRYGNTEFQDFPPSPHVTLK